MVFTLFPESQKGTNIATMPGCKMVKSKLRKNSDIGLSIIITCFIGLLGANLAVK